MRDHADNVVIICSIENIDPMGVHTGDSVTVAPALTLTDAQYQELRDAAKAIIRKIGVDTGGSNVQFAVNPETGEVVVIEMNPRVSRSSALASKATGFPIAKIAARLAVGYTLDEIDNDITRKTPACFEPTLDYVVVKMPRWAFEKFPMSDRELTTHMKSVGEAMAIGRTFKEAFQKAMRSRELDAPGELPSQPQDLRKALVDPHGRALRARAAGVPQQDGRRRGARAHRHLAVLPQRARRHRGAREGGARGAAAHARAPAAHEALRVQRQAPRRAHRPRRARGARAAHRARRAAGLQGRRHLRRRVPGRDPVLLLHLRGGERGRAGREGARRHPGLRPQPHRPGHRVRLLLRARRAHRPRAGLRGGHGQLQPGDGQHRLRHLRPPLLRAAHLRGRRQHRRQRAAQGRDRAVRRPDAAQDRPAAGRGGHPHPRHAAGVHRPGRGPRPLRGAARRARDPLPRVRARDDGRGGGRGGRTRGLPAARAAVVRARGPGHADRLRPGRARAAT